jgi:hypothetical protein
VPFDSSVRAYLPLTHVKKDIDDFLQVMRSQKAREATNVEAAMHVTCAMLQQSRPGARRIVIFETDGQVDYRRPSVDPIDTMICVAVNMHRNDTNRIRETLTPHHILAVDDFNCLDGQVGTILKLLGACAEYLSPVL